jgi:hypothetical protein
MNVTAKQLRLILLGLLGLVVIVFLVTAIAGLNALSSKSQKLVDVKLKNKTVDAQLTSLEQAKKQVEKYSYFNDIAKTVLPVDKDQAQAVLDIFQLADQSGIAIASVTFPASTLGVGSSSAPATGSTSAAISQAKPVQGIKGLYSLELTVAPQSGPSVPAGKVVTYPKFLDFLRRIERDRRTAQITQVNIQPQGSDAGPSQNLNFSLTVNIFMRPAK